VVANEQIGLPERDWLDRNAELAETACYERTIGTSIERVWENVRDWEHLPWLHASSFSSIECLDSGPWGWRARIGLSPATLDRSIGLELVIGPDEPRYVSRTLEGEGAGTEIWTDVEERGTNRSHVRVEFWLPDVAPEEREPLGDTLTRLYTQLWDEDEAMMQWRTSGLAERRDAASSQQIDLGLEDALRPTLPRCFGEGRRRVRIVDLDGTLYAHAVRCPHMLGPLDGADAEDVSSGEVRCPWHGYRFDIRTGRNSDGRSLRLRSAPRVVVDATSSQVTVEDLRDRKSAPGGSSA